ncbi:MAG: tRNA (adenosine(37)-N6)-threonylcarbamoyltransferase complex dimerization subunit type 1 TsaB [Labedaea sp.]
MNLGLAVETTTLHYGVAVFAEGKVLAHRTISRTDPSFESIGALAAAVLAGSGHTFGELTRLAVNNGPGSLTSVRAGVAYVNGLGFSLGCPIVAVDAFTLLAREVSDSLEEPVLVLRTAGGGNAYAGLFIAEAPPQYAHGPLDAVVPRLAGTLESVSCAGVFRDEARRLLTATRVKDTGVEVSSVLTLHALVTDPNRPSLAPVAVVSPLTDSSEVFRV